MDLIDLARRQLAADLADLTPAQWATTSLCTDWTVEQTLAHLTSAALLTQGRWLRSMVGAGMRASVHNRRRLSEQLGANPAQTLARFAALAPGLTGPSKHTPAWLGEVLVHGQDIRRPLGLPSPPAPWTPVAEFFASRNFAVNSGTVSRGLRLVADDGPFTAGDGPLVQGSTEALVMVMAGRRAYLDELDGDGVAVAAGRI